MEILAQKSITEIKNSQQGLHSRFDLAWEKKNSDLEDKLVEITYDKEQREKHKEK